LPIVLNPSKDGFEKVLRDYQIEALKMVWENPDKGVTSREVYAYVNKALEGVKTVSRASIINFLNAMCDDGVLNYEEETCKGGRRRRLQEVHREDCVREPSEGFPRPYHRRTMRDSGPASCSGGQAQELYVHLSLLRRSWASKILSRLFYPDSKTSWGDLSRSYMAIRSSFYLKSLDASEVS